MPHKNPDSHIRLIMFCPRCYSHDVKSFGVARSKAVKKKCNHCGYEDNYFPTGDPRDIPDVKKMPRWHGKNIKIKKGGKFSLIIILILLGLFLYGFFSIDLVQARIAFGVLIVFVLTLLYFKFKE